MLSIDLSGPTNGLIILSSVTLAIIQFTFTDLKSRFAEAQQRVKQEYRDRSYAFNNLHINTRYDIIRATKLTNIKYEMNALFFVLFCCAILKIVDMSDVYFHPSYTWQANTLLALIVLTVMFSLLLAWTAIKLKLIGETVRKTESLVEGCCEQVEAVALTIAGMRPSGNSTH